MQNFVCGFYNTCDMFVWQAKAKAVSVELLSVLWINVQKENEINLFHFIQYINFIPFSMWKWSANILKSSALLYEKYTLNNKKIPPKHNYLFWGFFQFSKPCLAEALLLV